MIARALRLVLPGLAVLILCVVAWLMWPVHPREDREWLPEFAVAPRVTFDGPRVRIEGVRDFRWRIPAEAARDGLPVVTEAWDTRMYDLDSLSTLWFALSPFDTDWRGPAHAFLSFGFGESTFVSASVEARKEVGESYSIWKGLVRQYELTYVIADERDMFPRRPLVFGDEVYLYPVRATPEAARELFVDMLERSNALHARPEYYNTVTNNCTNNLLDHVNQALSRRIRGGWRVILPGYSDELAYREGFIDTELPLEAARERYRVTEAVGRCASVAGFSRCIREGIAEERTRGSTGQ